VADRDAAGTLPTMSNPDPPDRASPGPRDISDAREEAIERLSSAFAHDEIGLADFEERVDAAYAATDGTGLRAVVQGLESDSAALVRVQTAEMSAPRPVAADMVSAWRSPDALAVLGNLQRSGAWRLEGGSRAVAVLGNIELDLRDVALPPGVTELTCRAVFGNIEITVPPNLAVECVGAGILGSFSSVHRIPAEGEGGRAVLRILGSAVFGNVEVHTLPRGMTDAQRAAPRRLPAGK
jgi:hypothetical protein